MPLTIDFSPYAGGNIYVEDDGIPGNGTGRTRHGSGGFPTASFAYPVDALVAQRVVTLLYKAEQVAYFDLFDPLVHVKVGSPVPAQAPDAIKVRKIDAQTLTMATNGAVTEWGSDAAADISGNILTILAATGIGTAGNALETQVRRLEARTTTGGINIRNYRDLDLGDAVFHTTGLSAGTTGDIVLEVHGDIRLESDSAGLSTITGGTTSGDVVLTAVGAGSSITSEHGAGHAITASAGDIVLDAGGDIGLGIAETANDDDLRADGSITIRAGGAFRIDGSANVISDAFGSDTGSGVTIEAGGGILVDKERGPFATVEALGTAGGDVTLTAGTGSALTILAPSAAAVFAQSGDVTVNADEVGIAATSGITANLGTVTIRPTTAGRTMMLGTTGLPDGALDRIFAPSLVLGGPNAGDVRVTAAISPANVQDVTIESGGDISVQGTPPPGTIGDIGSIAVSGDLVLEAANNILLEPGSSLSVGGTFTGFVDFGDDDPGEGGTAFVSDSFASTVRFFGGVDSDTLMGGANNDHLDGALGADEMLGRGGDDTYGVDHAGDRTIELADQGSDTVAASINWTLQANTEILTLLGAGNLTGTGNALANILNGNTGNNTLNGAAGSDTLLGNAGNDTLVGSDGNDLLNGGAGNDALNGGNQIDTASYAGAAAAVTVSLSIAGAQVTGGAGTDTLASIENLAGSDFADTLSGNTAANVLLGGDEGDTLNGLAGNDTLMGDAGNDTLVGGAGRDFLTGGAGADVFDFDAVGEAGKAASTRDQIEDFAPGSDKIDLSTIDASTVIAGNQAFAFIDASAFSGVAGQLRAVVDGGYMVVQGDVNGDRAADFHIQLNTPYALTAGDFIL